MKYLLDTHSFLWWLGDDDRLSDTARGAISDANNEIFFSVASAWEMAIKTGSGKLSVDSELSGFLKRNLDINHFSVLPVTLSHSLQIVKLPHYHRDPFDRMLIAQTQVEQAQLITRDPEIAKYAVNICW